MDLAHDAKSPGKRPALSAVSPELRLWLRRRAWTLPILGVVGLGLVGSLLGVGPLLLTLAALALASAIFLIWHSLLALSEEVEPRLEDALTLWESSVEDERKQAVLRALKDLDYERAVGKIAEDDYQRLRTRYRAEARALLTRSAVEDTELERASRVLEQRLQRLGKQRPAPAAETPGDETPETAAAPNQPSSEPEPATGAAHRCAACQTGNDADARFCKGCGAPLAPVRSVD